MLDVGGVGGCFDLDVSENSGFSPKSSILIGFSIIFTIHILGETPSISGNTHFFFDFYSPPVRWGLLDLMSVFSIFFLVGKNGRYNETRRWKKMDFSVFFIKQLLCLDSTIVFLQKQFLWFKTSSVMKGLCKLPSRTVPADFSTPNGGEKYGNQNPLHSGLKHYENLPRMMI